MLRRPIRFGRAGTQRMRCHILRDVKNATHESCRRQTARAQAVGTFCEESAARRTLLCQLGPSRRIRSVRGSCIQRTYPQGFSVGFSVGQGRASGLQAMKTRRKVLGTSPPRSKRATIGECLDHVSVLDERHVRRVRREYVDCYQSCRTRCEHVDRRASVLTFARRGRSIRGNLFWDAQAHAGVPPICHLEWRQAIDRSL